MHNENGSEFEKTLGNRHDLSPWDSLHFLQTTATSVRHAPWYSHWHFISTVDRALLNASSENCIQKKWKALNWCPMLCSVSP